MGFGIDLNIKVEAPKVEVPKVDLASAASQAAGAITKAASSAIDTAQSAVAGAAAAVTGTVESAIGAAAGLAGGVAGAIADVACSYTGAIEDLVLEPHLQLSANASFAETKFEKGPIVIFVEYTADEARESSETLRLFSASGAYDEKKKICDFSEDSEGIVGVVFDDVPMAEKFSLEVMEDDGKTYTMFTGVPYGDLRKSRQRYLISEEER